MDGRHTYIAIDLKSFYASVECMERGLDPLRTCLTVADGTRTEKTICLAVSPALKSFGIPGRPRLFEVNQKVREVNAARKRNAPGGRLSGESYDAEELKKDPSLAGLLEESRKADGRRGRVPGVRITYFLPDQKKSGGAYLKQCGAVTDLDWLRGEIVMEDGTRIPAEDVVELELVSV